MRSLLPISLLAATLLASTQALALPGKGTLEDPIRVDAFPYAIAGNTVDAPSDLIDAYSCAPNTNESGREVVFSFELKTRGRVTAWVTGDSATVDIDVQLLSALSVVGGVAQSCESRSNIYAEADFEPGVHYVVVDTYAGESNAGPFVLRLDAATAEWSERFVAEGVALLLRRYDDPTYGPQVAHALRVDPQNPAVSIAALPATGCQTIDELGTSVGAAAGINGGFFAGDSCAPASFLKHENVLVAKNALARGVFGLSASAEASIALVAAGVDEPAFREAQGGGPILVSMGAPQKGALAWAKEGFTSPAFLGKNPRSVAAIDQDGSILFATIDGKRANATGLSLDELATFAAEELHANSALNLDGVDSTTLWVAGQTPSGIVSYPSGDPAQETSAHEGARAVGGGLFVFAPPYAHPPRFQTEPILSAELQAPYVYDADAIDLDVTDTITFSLQEGPVGMTVDASTGIVSYTPPADAYEKNPVVLVAKDNTGLATTQSFTLQIPSGKPGGGGGGGGEGGGGGSGGGSGQDGEKGCACTIPAPQSPPNASLLVTLLAACAMVCRKRRRSCA